MDDTSDDTTTQSDEPKDSNEMVDEGTGESQRTEPDDTRDAESGDTGGRSETDVSEPGGQTDISERESVGDESDVRGLEEDLLDQLVDPIYQAITEEHVEGTPLVHRQLTRIAADICFICNSNPYFFLTYIKHFHTKYTSTQNHI